MLNRSLLLFAAAALALSAVGPVSAAVSSPGVDFTSPGTTVSSNSSWTLGYEFTANAGAVVTGLATWNSWNTPGTVEVGLWDASGNLLAQTTVSNTSPTIGSASWSYESIAALALTAGATYYVGSYGTAAGYSYNPSGFSVDSHINFVRDAWQYEGYGLPASTDNLTGFFGGNVILGAPEPSTWVMIGLGFAGLAFASYRSRRVASASA